MDKITNLKEAIIYFKQNLTEKIIEEDFVGYCYFIKTKKNRYCITFKRDYYKNFGLHFNNSYGYGQIANKKLLQICKELGYIFIMVMPDKKIYKIKPNIFLDFYNHYNTDVPYLDGEISCPLKLFERF